MPRLPSLPRRRRRHPQPPLVPDAHSVTVGASHRLGLLHHLRGAPSQDRNAILVPPDHSLAMLSLFSGHGKHGARLATLAASTLSASLSARLFPPSRSSSSSSSTPTPTCPPPPSSSSLSSSSFSSLDSTSPPPPPSLPPPSLSSSSSAAAANTASAPVSLERALDDAFVDVNIAVDALVHARNSGAAATVCLLSRTRLVVAHLGNASVMVASRRNGVTTLRRVSTPHQLALADERARVARFAGRPVSMGDVARPLVVTRALGDVEMRRWGVCQIPTIRTHSLGPKDTFVVVSSVPLWGEGEVAPQRLADVVGKGTGVVDMAEELMRVAFGVTGPTLDATILCARLS